MNAMAELGTGGPGLDNLSPEIFKLLPWSVVLHIHQLFEERFLILDDDDEEPENWKKVVLTGIPKPDEPTNTVKGLRWIGQQAVLEKWYRRSSRPIIQGDLAPSSVHASTTSKIHSPSTSLYYYGKD